MASIADKENAVCSQFPKPAPGKMLGFGNTKKRALKDIVVQQKESEGSKQNGKKLNFEIPDYIKNFDFNPNFPKVKST